MSPASSAGSSDSLASTLLSSKAQALSLRQKLLVLMFLGDAFFGYAGLCFAYWLRFESPLAQFGVPVGEDRSFLDYQPVLVMGIAFLLFGFVQQKLYNWKLLLRPRKLIPLSLRAITFWFVIYLFTSLTLKFEPQISRIFMLYAWGTVMVAVGLWKLVFTHLLRSTGQAEHLAQRLVIVGWTQEAADLADAIYGDGHHPYRIAGWIRSEAESGHGTTAPSVYTALGGLDQLDAILAEAKPDMLIVADLDLNREALARISKLCEVYYVQLKILPSMFQIFVSGLHLETISGRPLLGIEDLPIQRLTSQLLKRTVDIVGALIGLTLSAPAMLVLAIMIKREDPKGPIFYRQTRSGLKGESFTIFKLRSMKVNAEAAGGAQWAVKDDPRRLKIGKFMRESNLDEVPQFWNVLKGDMSLVGPRPERPELIKNFETQIQHYNHRHHVKPGITGWAQIHGLRGDTDLTERVRYDCYYIENWSLWMDFYCLVMTFFKRDNAY